MPEEGASLTTLFIASKRGKPIKSGLIKNILNTLNLREVVY